MVPEISKPQRVIPRSLWIKITRLVVLEISKQIDTVPEISNAVSVVLEISNLTADEREKMRENQLLPERYPNGELFLCDLGDVVLKDDTASMEHPIFALSTKPDTRERRYEHRGNEITITPSARGLATIHDKDILIFAISHIMEAKKQGMPYGREVVFNAHDFMRFSNRMTNGQAYEGLRDALVRLGGTRIETNIITGDVEQIDGFGLIDKYRVRRKLRDGTVTDWGITLSEWLFNAIEANEVLTIHRDYFRLRKPLERRIYEIARKHCGHQARWKISLDLLRKKTGSQSSAKKFKQLMKEIVDFNHLPTYQVSFTDDGSCVFINTSYKEAEQEAPASERIILKQETYERVRDFAPGYDKYYLEEAWRAWMYKKGIKRPKNPDGAFLGFCRSFYEKNGAPK